MNTITPGVIWGYILSAAGAIVLIANAIEKVIIGVKSVKAPEHKQNEEIQEIKKDVAEIKEKLEKDKARLDKSDDANRVTQEALLALLEHGINGNNIDQMCKAKNNLQKYLINH